MKQHFATAARVILIAALSCMGADKAFCNIIIVGPAPADHIHQLPATDSDDSITLNPDPVTYLAGATPAMRVALAADFPIWTFSYAAGLNGTLNIYEYKATTEQDDNGGGLIDATYTRAATDPAIADLHWIQLVVTNFPASGKPTTGYLDNDATGLPFYTFDIQNGNKTDTTFDFFDNSSRNDRTDPDFITWRGQLVLGSWDNNNPGKVTIYDGINWGWDLVDVPVDVPEPSTLACLGLGCCLLIVLRSAANRRRRRSI